MVSKEIVIAVNKVMTEDFEIDTSLLKPQSMSALPIASNHDWAAS